ncbi:hypothetical protein SeLEV6574_g04309 [Synchytrium endobioticum]|nr:hypothetical protein SeLEV6574_g04309 [Synchytrium endobioticum]
MAIAGEIEGGDRRDTIIFPFTRNAAEAEDVDEDDVANDQLDDDEEEDAGDQWTLAPDEEKLQVGVWRLMNNDGPSFPVYECLNTIGRGDSSTICLSTPGVSAQHAELYVTPKTHYIFLCDVGSTNGTIVKDSQDRFILNCKKEKGGSKTWYQVQSGWTICVGPATSRFELSEISDHKYANEKRRTVGTNPLVDDEDVDKVTSEDDEPQPAEPPRGRFLPETVPLHANTFGPILNYDPDAVNVEEEEVCHVDGSIDRAKALSSPVPQLKRSINPGINYTEGDSNNQPSGNTNSKKNVFVPFEVPYSESSFAVSESEVAEGNVPSSETVFANNQQRQRDTSNLAFSFSIQLDSNPMAASKVDKLSTAPTSQREATSFVTGERALAVVDELGSLETYSSSLPGQSMFMTVTDGSPLKDQEGVEVPPKFVASNITGGASSAPIYSRRTLTGLADAAEMHSETSSTSSVSSINEDNGHEAEKPSKTLIGVKASAERKESRRKRASEKAISVFDSQSLPKEGLDDAKEPGSDSEPENSNPPRTPIKHTYSSRSKSGLARNNSKERHHEDDGEVGTFLPCCEQAKEESDKPAAGKKRRLGAGRDRPVKSASKDGDDVGMDSRRCASKRGKSNAADTSKEDTKTYYEVARDDGGENKEDSQMVPLNIDPTKSIQQRNGVTPAALSKDDVSVSNDQFDNHHPVRSRISRSQRKSSARQGIVCLSKGVPERAVEAEIIGAAGDDEKDSYQPVQKSRGDDKRKSASQARPRAKKDAENGSTVDETPARVTKSRSKRETKASDEAEIMLDQLSVAEGTADDTRQTTSALNIRKQPRIAHTYTFTDDDDTTTEIAGNRIRSRGTSRKTTCQAESAAPAPASSRGGRKRKATEQEIAIERGEDKDLYMKDALKEDEEDAVLQPSSKRLRRTPQRSESTSSRQSIALSGDVQGVRIIFTGLDEKQTKKMNGLMDKLGWKHAKSWKDCSHLITTGVKRTSKFLSVLASGKHIVSTSWLEESAKTKHAADEELHTIQDATHEMEWDLKLVDSLKAAAELRNRGEALFSGLSFFATPSVVPPKAEMKEIIEAAGGKLLNTLPKSGTESLIVVASAEDTPEIKKAKKLGVDVVNKDFVILSILRMNVAQRQEFAVE